MQESDLINKGVEEIKIEEGLEIMKIDTIDSGKIRLAVNKSTILFIYGLEKKCGLAWPDHKLSHVLAPVTILVYSYPLKDSSIELSLIEKSNTCIVKVSIAKLHEFFGSNFGSNPDEIQAFVGSFRMKNVFSEKAVTPAVSVIFHQFFNNNISGPLRKLFLRGKFMEFLSIYMQQPKANQELSAQCSFVNDHMEMKKIKEARDLIVRDLISPPNLKDLAHMVGTNEFKLKVGFKSMFGNTVYGYLNEFRMEKARHLLEEREHSVKEVSNIVGYSNPSHFISAYKKKFGVTPKKYLLSA